MPLRRSAPLLLLLTLLGCQDNAEPSGLLEAPLGGGPQIIFDLEAEPLPEIPFPNDLATRPDPSSPTGRRVNISQIAPTEVERDVRMFADRLDGFGTYGAITVSFDAPLDVRDLYDRHADHDPANDALFLVDITPDSPTFGERVPLDVGNGNFPLVQPGATYFPNDYHAGESNILLETRDEDINGDGVLQPEEDTDHDGVLDRPNVMPGSEGDTVDDLVTFFEFESNTLIVRPVLPLRERTTYAVVLTSRLVGVDGEPIRSPFRYIHHTRQREALAPLPEILEGDLSGIALEEVAFAWTFTTQSITHDLVQIRRGLYGHGPFGWLAEAYPPVITRLEAWREAPVEEMPHLLTQDVFQPVFEVVSGIVLEEVSDDPESGQALLDSHLYVDYVVSGSFDTPYFLIDRDGHASELTPADDDEIWEIDADAGEGIVGPTEVTWWCFVPREELRPTPGEPFPVVIYAHGYSSARLESVGFAGNLAKFGFATCSIDAPSHGLVIPTFILNDPLLGSLLKSLKVDNLTSIFSRGRARDLNVDGVADPGGDYWSANTFHTRDIVRQSVVDLMMLIRVLRQFDGVQRFALPADLPGTVDLDALAGDFNADGVVDLGGPDADYYIWGQSLGGILAAILPVVEPAIVAAAPVSSGGGLTDVSMRTDLGQVKKAIWLPVLGPILYSRPNRDDPERMDLLWHTNNVNDDADIFITTLAPGELEPGDHVTLTNLINDEVDTVRADASGRVRLAVAADALSATERQAIYGVSVEDEEPRVFSGEETLELADAVRIEIHDADGGLKRVVDRYENDAPVAWQGIAYGDGAALVVPGEGFGLKRQTPRLRRFMSIAQSIVDPADPINYAARYDDPVDFSDIEPEAQAHREHGLRVLIANTVGDMSVPVNAGISVARAAGFVPIDEVDPRYGMSPNDLLIDRYVYEAVEQFQRFGPEYGSILFDPDDLDRGGDGYDAPSLDTPLRMTLERADGAQVGHRLPYMRPGGEHGFALPAPSKDFDIDTFMVNQIGAYFLSRGTVISDDPCLEDNSCDFMPPLPER